MFPRSENNIRSNILFEVQSPGCCNITTSLDDSLPAPTIFTGHQLRGTLLVSHVERQEHVFDVVKLTLQGIECGYTCINTERLIIVL